MLFNTFKGFYKVFCYKIAERLELFIPLVNNEVSGNFIFTHFGNFLVYKNQFSDENTVHFPGKNFEKDKKIALARRN